MLLRKLQAMKAKKGFTLVELIVVIAIIAVLAAILIPILMNYLTNSRISSADSEAKGIYNIAAGEATERDGKNLETNLADITAKVNEDMPNLPTGSTWAVYINAAEAIIGVQYVPNPNNASPLSPDDFNALTDDPRNRRNIYGIYGSGDTELT